MVQRGYYEIITYSFISPAELIALDFPSRDPRLKTLNLVNPLSEEQSIMRTTLMPGLFSTMRKNINQKNYNLRLFELGSIFLPQGKDELPREEKMLAALTTGLHQDEEWNIESREVDFYDLKGCLESLFEALRISDFAFTPCADIPLLHPSKALSIMINQTQIGMAGELHPRIMEHYQLPHKVYFFEFSLSPLIKHSQEVRKFRSLPKYPPIHRDIAVVVDDTVPAEKVYNTILTFKNKYIEEISIFDYYKGNQIPEGKKSLAYRLKYQAYDHTLTDQEVNTLQESLIATLNRELGAEIRE
jgi:phenylalanyl-tRNA synthetase beta chain